MKIYNTLSRTKEEFTPINTGKVGMYVCGPTVYDHCHLGHAKGYVSMDVLRRYLKWTGLEVKYVQNFTDVGHLTDDGDEGEDKIEKRAKQTNVEPLKLVEKFIDSYYADFRSLNVIDPDVAPRPSEEIPEIFEFITELIEKGYAYESNGSVYFSVSEFKDYGKLSGRIIEDLISGSRVGIRTEKKNPLDFALWIKAEPGHILKWESPWSIGYPGWHIECSVMSKKYLSSTFDIHGGGIENVFPHNESEIAQTEALTGKQMANYWVLWNMVMVNGEKMGKSKGNFTTIHDLLQRHDPMVVRLAIIKSHYRSPLDFNEKMFEEAANNLNTIKEIILKLIAVAEDNSLDKKGQWELVTQHKGMFTEAMDDDFNTPKALSVIFDFIKELNKGVTQGITKSQAKQALEQLFSFDEVLGLRLKDTEPTEVNSAVGDLLEDREVARNSKDWQKSDEIRDQIRNLGFEVEDGANGQTIKKI